MTYAIHLDAFVFSYFFVHWGIGASSHLQPLPSSFLPSFNGFDSHSFSMTKTSLCFVSRPSFEHGLHTPLVRRHIAWATSYFLTHFSFRKGIYSKVLLLLLSISLSLSSPDMPIQSKIVSMYHGNTLWCPIAYEHCSKLMRTSAHIHIPLICIYSALSQTQLLILWNRGAHITILSLR